MFLVSRFRRFLVLLVIALTLLSALAVGSLTQPKSTLAYVGEVSSTWYFGLTHPNTGCHYDIFVAYGYEVRMFCRYHDSYGRGYRMIGSDYQYLGCWTPGGCFFSGNISSLGWDWVADSVSFTYNDGYSGWHGYIRNAWPTG